MTRSIVWAGIVRNPDKFLEPEDPSGMPFRLREGERLVRETENLPPPNDDFTRVVFFVETTP